MSIQLIRTTNEHIPELARIMYDAFRCVAEQHAFRSEIFSAEMAVGAMTSFVTRPDMYGVAATLDGKIVGHNFLQMTDAVAGLGPICVDPHVQAKGIGRALMQHVVEYGLKHHGPQVRLVQEGFNMTSLSLYASVGFAVKEPLALMAVPPLESAPGVRPLTQADVPAADALQQRTQRVSRKNEIALMIEHGPAMGCVPHGLFEKGVLSGYCVPGFFGFGAAESPEALQTAAQVAVKGFPPPLQRLILPTRQSDLFALALQRKFKTLKVLQLMAVGPYDDGTGTWAPSIQY